MVNAKPHRRMTEALTRYFKQAMQLEIKITTEEVATPIKQLAAEQKDSIKISYFASHARSQSATIDKICMMLPLRSHYCHNTF